MRTGRRLQAPIAKRRLKMDRRTKYDAPMPRVRKCDVDKYAIWRAHHKKRKRVSKDLESIVFNALKKEREEIHL